MTKYKRIFLTAFSSSLLAWGAISGIAVVNYHLEFGGFDGFGDHYGILSPEPLTIVIKTDGKEFDISLKTVNTVISDPLGYIVHVPRPLRMALVAKTKIEQMTHSTTE